MECQLQCPQMPARGWRPAKLNGSGEYRARPGSIQGKKFPLSSSYLQTCGAADPVRPNGLLFQDKLEIWSIMKPSDFAIIGKHIQDVPRKVPPCKAECGPRAASSLIEPIWTQPSGRASSACSPTIGNKATLSLVCHQ